MIITHMHSSIKLLTSFDMYTLHNSTFTCSTLRLHKNDAQFSYYPATPLPLIIFTNFIVLITLRRLHPLTIHSGQQTLHRSLLLLQFWPFNYHEYQFMVFTHGNYHLTISTTCPYQPSNSSMALECLSSFPFGTFLITTCWIVG